MYGDQIEVSVSATVRYQDGREGIIETTVRVDSLKTKETTE